MGEPNLLVDAEALRVLTRDCFEGVGIPSADSSAVADVLIDANLHGIDSHGFQRVPIYMERVIAGLAGGTQHLTVRFEEGGLCRMDAGLSLGPAAAVTALDHAVVLARRHGMSLVAIGQSNHFGAAGYYARRAAAAGLVGIVMSNAVKRMVPFGALEAFLGTNPLAVGIPLRHHDPFVLDMSSSVVAQGKITRARDLGQQLDAGVAIDSAGRPTTDPVAALAGSLLPVGGPKGSGLALAISMLMVLLAGADCDDEMGSMYRDFDRPQNVGHLFIVVDHTRFRTSDDDDSLDDMIDRLGALRTPEGAGAPKYPGEDRSVLARTRRRDGVPVDQGELRRVAAVCSRQGLSDLERRALDLLTSTAPHL